MAHPIWYLLIAYLLGSWVGYMLGYGRGWRAAGKVLCSRRSGDPHSKGFSRDQDS